MEEIEKSLCSGSDEAIAYRLRDDCAGVDQELGTCRAREYLLSGRVKAVAVGLGSHPEQPAVIFVRSPRQQGRILRQQLPQTFDVIVMDAAADLGHGPLESPAQALVYFSHQVLPAWKPIFASTNWASRCDNGSSACGSWACARAMALASPATMPRASFLACLRRDSREGRAGSLDVVITTSFHERL